MIQNQKVHLNPQVRVIQQAQARLNHSVRQHLTVHPNQQAHQKVIQQVKVRHYQIVHQSQQAQVHQIQKVKARQ